LHVEKEGACRVHCDVFSHGLVFMEFLGVCLGFVYNIYATYDFHAEESYGFFCDLHFWAIAFFMIEIKAA
jgi:hypothetical protein